MQGAFDPSANKFPPVSHLHLATTVHVVFLPGTSVDIAARISVVSLTLSGTIEPSTKIFTAIRPSRRAISLSNAMNHALVLLIENGHKITNVCAANLRFLRLSHLY